MFSVNTFKPDFNSTTEDIRLSEFISSLAQGQKGFLPPRPSSSTTLSSKAHHLQNSLNPRVRLHSASRAHHLQHNSRLEGLSVTKRPSSSTTLSSKAHHLQHSLSREGLSAKDPRVRLHSASRAHHLQHNSRLEGLSVTKKPSSSTTLSSKAHHLQHSLSREGLSAKDPRVRLHSASRAHHLQHNSRLEGLSVTKRPSSSTPLSSKAHHLQHSLSREGLSAKDLRDQLRGKSSLHNSSMQEGLSVNKTVEFDSNQNHTPVRLPELRLGFQRMFKQAQRKPRRSRVSHTGHRDFRLRRSGLTHPEIPGQLTMSTLPLSSEQTPGGVYGVERSILRGFGFFGRRSRRPSAVVDSVGRWSESPRERASEPSLV
ncbi:hypothetical protein F3Y22_tig00109987pilonHSYRG00049 [Hibiscus syriacus]|uniref:Uncharacterized protein n=1 Tax=Hibiscus syriacus TaxID=106335 RepID=A0A6A3BTK8_HIBSY|nr:hypothetical protein F3Y22_tig00109987pilonHSYRG00049 [Hibiscus syriacus]